MEHFKSKSCSNSFIKLSSHEVTIAMKVFHREKVIVEEFGGQPREMNIEFALLSYACDVLCTMCRILG
jgi:hypothetical protein